MQKSHGMIEGLLNRGRTRNRKKHFPEFFRRMFLMFSLAANRQGWRRESNQEEDGGPLKHVRSALRRILALSLDGETPFVNILRMRGVGFLNNFGWRIFKSRTRNRSGATIFSCRVIRIQDRLR